MKCSPSDCFVEKNVLSVFKELYRTNNHAEAYNKYILLNVGGTHPSVWLFLGKTEISTTLSPQLRIYRIFMYEYSLYNIENSTCKVCLNIFHLMLNFHYSWFSRVSVSHHLQYERLKSLVPKFETCIIIIIIIIRKLFECKFAA
jgi:hypothetical protein